MGADPGSGSRLRAELPAGTVTFWMTDIEGSTRLLQDLGGTRYAAVLAEHHGLVRAAVSAAGGVEVSTEGDAFFCVFRAAADAVRAAADVQRSLAGHSWPPGSPVRVRIGVHTGEALVGRDGYVGLDVHRTARVASAAAGGQVLLTAASHDLVHGRWPPGTAARPLGSHRLKDLASPEVLYQLLVDGLPDEFPPPPGGTAGPALPGLHRPVVGRERELREVTDLLGGHRLVTLTGPGGVGKTTLAVRVAGQLAGRYPGGAGFVPLAAVTDAGTVPGEVARALGLAVPAAAGPAGRSPLAGRVTAPTLVVLDNLEQLAGGARQVAAVLDAAPALTVLATSRGPLRLSFEQEYPVEPLALPGAADTTVEQLLGHAAVRQFVDRARAARPGFELVPEVADDVKVVVTGVGGLPLAIELVAARLRTMTPRQVAERMDAQLRLLRGGAVDLPSRHRTLRDTLQWSYDLLDPPARELLAALALFPGGATLDALEAVSEPVLGEDDVLDAVEGLVEHGMLVPSADGSGRYRTLQVVREFAAELLAGAGWAPRAQARQLAWLEHVVTGCEPLLLTERQGEAVDRLDAEHDNLRAALHRAGDTDPVAAARTAAGLWRYWQVRGRLPEGRALLERLSSRLPADADPRVRARLMTALGGVRYWQRDLPGSAAAYEQAARLHERLDDAAGLAARLYDWAYPLWLAGSAADAAALADRSGRLFAELGDRVGVARTLSLRGVLALMEGRLDDAEALLRDAVEGLRTAGDSYDLRWALRNQGRTALLQGRPGPARRALEPSLRLFAAARDVSAVVLHLSDFATLAGLEGDDEQQARLVGAMRALQQATGTDLVDAEVNRVPDLDAALARLGDRADAVLAEGAAMGVDEAVRCALGGGRPPEAAR